MCISVFFAQVIGVYLFLVSLAMLTHHARFKKTLNEAIGSLPIMTLAGTISLIFGLVIVVTHNLWVAQWPVLITIVGWLAILQGIMRLFFPDTIHKWTKDITAGSGYRVWCWLWLLVGLYLIWVGFAG